MTDSTKTIIKLAVAGVLGIAGIALAALSLQQYAATGEEGARVWFYDQSEQQLYAVPRNTLPPHAGIGGAPDDGVRAIVVACRGEQDDPSKRRIAYLETYTPELKRVLEDIRAARAAGRAPKTPLPADESDFVQRNTRVRRLDKPTWYEADSSAARRIMNEWRTWPCADGGQLIVCNP